MKCDLKLLLEEADKKGFAIPAFNYSDVWEMLAIIDAAVEENAPVIIATNAQVAKTLTIPYLGAQGISVINNAPIPVVHHLDHALDKNNCKLAIMNGYTSVMIDASHLPLDENIASVKEIVEYAKPYNVAVEGEIGRIKGNNAEGTYTGDDFLVNVEAAVQMAEKSGVTSLAIGIGNAHGFYTEKPQINFQRLQEVNEAVSVPLVLHGGTGIPEEDIRKCIQLGINKVNIGTHLHHSYLVALRKEVESNPDSVNIVNIMDPVRKAVKKEVKKWIHICKADGKA